MEGHTRTMPVNNKTGTHEMWIATFTWIDHERLVNQAESRVNWTYWVMVISPILSKSAINQFERHYSVESLTKSSCFSRFKAMLGVFRGEPDISTTCKGPETANYSPRENSTIGPNDEKG